MSEFRTELQSLINAHNKESGSNTPDFVLCDYLCACKRAFDEAVEARGHWFVGTGDGHTKSDELTTASAKETP